MHGHLHLHAVHWHHHWHLHSGLHGHHHRHHWHHHSREGVILHLFEHAELVIFPCLVENLENEVWIFHVEVLIEYMRVQRRASFVDGVYELSQIFGCFEYKLCDCGVVGRSQLVILQFVVLLIDLLGDIFDVHLGINGINATIEVVVAHFKILFEVLFFVDVSHHVNNIDCVFVLGNILDKGIRV